MKNSKTVHQQEGRVCARSNAISLVDFVSKISQKAYSSTKARSGFWLGLGEQNISRDFLMNFARFALYQKRWFCLSPNFFLPL